MEQDALKSRANAVLSVRLTKLMVIRASEILAYGTAVKFK